MTSANVRCGVTTSTDRVERRLVKSEKSGEAMTVRRNRNGAGAFRVATYRSFTTVHRRSGDLAAGGPYLRAMEQRLTRPSLNPGSGVKLVIGIFFTLLGVLWTLDNLDILDSEMYFHYAPAVLIVIGLLKLADPTARGVAIVLIAGGTLLLAWTTHWMRLSIFDLWPLIFIAVGFSILMQALGLRRPRSSAPSDPSSLRVAAVFSNREESVTARDFKGGRIVSFLGSCELDLTRADITNGPAVLEVIVVMAGIEMFVPEGWEVVGDVLPFMGGVEIKLRTPSRPGTASRRLIVRGLVMMGGIDIKDMPARTV